MPDLIKYLIVAFMDDTFYEAVLNNGWSDDHVLARRKHGWLIMGDHGLEEWTDTLTVEDFRRMLASEVDEHRRLMMDGNREPCLWQAWDPEKF